MMRALDDRQPVAVDEQEVVEHASDEEATGRNINRHA
jgi:hypothetical protein